MNQDEIRQKLNWYIKSEGVTAKHIAKKLDLNESVLSKFRKNRIDLYPEQLDMIEDYLDSKNVL